MTVFARTAFVLALCCLQLLTLTRVSAAQELPMSAAERAQWERHRTDPRRVLDAEIERVLQHIRANALERSRILTEGRPEHYRRRKIGGLSGILAGGALVMVPVTFGAAAFAGLLLSGFDSPDADDGPALSRGTKVAILIPLPIGLALIGLGIWARATADRPNRNRDLPELQALRAEHSELQNRLRELRQQRDH